MNKILQFPEGNLGIADTIKKNFNLKALSSVKDLDALRQFVDKGGLKLDKSFDSYIDNGKLKINLSDINFNPSQNFNGLKSLEISTIKSIFETQKPYMEIIGLATKSLIDVEDTIARTLGLADSSLKPKFNDKALGFQYKLFKSDANKLQNLNSNKNKNSSQSNTNSGTNDNGTGIGLSSSVSTDYEIVSVEYSTGDRKDNVTYETIYRDIKEDKLILDDTEILDNYIQLKPDVIVFGISNYSGIPINPPEWLVNSGKWYGQFPQLGGFSYIWKRGEQTVVSAGTPDKDNYGEGWENTEEKVFNNNDAQKYTNFYNFKLEDRLANTSDLTEEYKNEVRTIVRRAINPNGALNSISEDGFILDFTPDLFTPKKANDPVRNASYLPGITTMNGKEIWVDPEGEYDMKVIKIDSTLDIAFFDSIGNRVETRIQRFLTNNYELSYNDDAIFDFQFLNTDQLPTNTGLSGSNIGSSSSFIGVDKVSFDNITTDVLYDVEVIRRKQPTSFRPIFWKNNSFNNYSLDYPDFTATITVNVTATQSGTQSTPSVSGSTDTEYNYVFKKGDNWIYGIYSVSLKDVVSDKASEAVNSIANAFADVVNTVTNNDTIQVPEAKNDLELNNTDSASPAPDGTYTIPLYGEIIVRDGIIYGWKSKFNGFSIKDSQQILTIISGDDVSTTTINTLEVGSIRVSSNDSRFGLIINAKQIRNEHLQIPDLYDKDKFAYGTQKITQLYRYRVSLIDTDTYYLIEGYDLDSFVDSLDTGNGSNPSPGGGGSGYYKKRHALGAPGVFIGVLIKILTKLIPKITSLIQLLQNPANFITEPIIKKLGEAFELFDPNIIKDFNAVKGMNPTERFDYVKNNFQLFKYVDVDKATGNIRHILDGRATTNLFGIEFGLELKDLVLKLIFKNNNADLLKDFKSVFDNHGLNGGPVNSLLDLGPTTTQTTTNTYNGVTTKEEIDTVYSTGVKKDDVNYKYIYVTQYVQELINQYEQYKDNGDFENALDALERAQVADPKNDFIKNLIDKLREKILSLLNPLLKLILELVTMPIKLIKGIIDFISDLFKSLSIDNIASKMEEFMSFKWLLEMMSPEKLLGLIGLKMDIGLLNEWKLNYKSLPDDYIFDLSKILTIPLFAKLPKVPKEVFPHMMNLLCETINSMLTLIQGIINSIIDLIWALVSLDALIPVPHLNITLPCAKNNKYSISQLFDIINANNNGNNSSNGNNGLFDFLYDVRLPDGRSIQDLDRNKLSDFIKENGDLEFTFNF